MLLILTLVGILAGCSSAGSVSGSSSHFTSKGFPAGEAMIKKYFAPSAALTWGPITRRAETRDTHFFGAPTSVGNGSSYDCEATAGKLTYSVHGLYQSNGLILITAAVRDGKQYKEDVKPSTVLKAFNVDPALKAAIRDQTGFIRYDGVDFYLSSTLPDGTDISELQATIEMKP